MTEVVFTISKIQLTIPVTYKITDHNREEIQGSFYEQELQDKMQDILRREINVLLNGWVILIRLTRGLITKQWWEWV